MMKLLIGKTGAVEDVVVVTSLSDAMDRGAIKSARQWRYAPATLHGEPVAVWMTVTVTYRFDTQYGLPSVALCVQSDCASAPAQASLTILMTDDSGTLPLSPHPGIDVPLPGMDVVLTSRATGATYRAVTDSEGRALFSGIRAGEYQVSTVGLAVYPDHVLVEKGLGVLHVRVNLVTSDPIMIDPA